MRHRSAVLFLTLSLLLGGCDESPTGRRQLTLLPDQQMAAMGERAFADLKRTQVMETDPRVTTYVHCVAQAIVNVLPTDRQRGWEVVVFRDPTPNAFALPGRKIGVHTGMLKVAGDPAQLAAVIGHEVGHVLADHGNERATQELAVQGGLALFDLLYQSEEGWKHEALRNALGLGAQVGVLLPFSRTHESEADTIGLDLMARAGFDPHGSVELWRNMAQAGGSQPLEFLSTHPAHDTRLKDLAAQVETVLPIYQEARMRGKRPQCQAGLR